MPPWLNAPGHLSLGSAVRGGGGTFMGGHLSLGHRSYIPSEQLFDKDTTNQTILKPFNASSMKKNVIRVFVNGRTLDILVFQ